MYQSILLHVPHSGTNIPSQFRTVPSYFQEASFLLIDSFSNKFFISEKPVPWIKAKYKSLYMDDDILTLNEGFSQLQSMKHALYGKLVTIPLSFNYTFANCFSRSV